MVNHTTDSIIHCEGTYIIQESGSLIDLEDSSGSLIHSTATCTVIITHTTDSELSPAGERKHDTDSILKQSDKTVTHTTSTVLTCQGNNLTQEDGDLLLTEDNATLVYSDKTCTIELIHTTDSDVQKHGERFHTTDSIVGERQPGLDVYHTTSTVLTCQGNNLTQEDGDLLLTENGETLVYADKLCTITITHTTDSFFLAKYTVSHTTDSVIGERDPGLTVSHTTDSVVKSLDNELSHTTDSVIKSIDDIVIHTTDSVIKSVDNTIAHTTDSTVKKLDYIIAHNTDTSVTGRKTVSHTTDSVVGEREPGFTKFHNTDSYLLWKVTISHTTDSVVKSIDSIIAHTTNSVVKSLDSTVAHTTDSVTKSLDNELSHTTDSILGEREPGFTVAHTTDSVFKSLDDTINHTTDSVIGERDPGFTIYHTTDSHIVDTVVRSLSHTTDSIIHCGANQLTQEDGDLIILEDGSGSLVYSDSVCTVEINHTTDSHIVKKYIVSHTTDSVLGERDPGLSVYHNTDSTLQGVGSTTHNTDSYLIISGESYHTTDSVTKSLDRIISHTTDSVIGEREPGFTIYHTTDSVTKKIDNELSHNTDSVLKGEILVNHDTDSILKGTGLTVNHTTDTRVKPASKTIYHTTDSFLKERLQRAEILVTVPSNVNTYPSIPSNEGVTIYINGIEEITVIG